MSKSYSVTPKRLYPGPSARFAAANAMTKSVCDAKGEAMTMMELSRSYEASAALLRERMRFLRALLKTTEDPEELWHIRRRILELTPILTQTNELAELTAHYYDRGYYRSEKYTV